MGNYAQMKNALAVKSMGNSTPMVSKQPSKAISTVKSAMQASIKNTTKAPVNAQVNQMAQSLAKNNKVQKTFGVPGAK